MSKWGLLGGLGIGINQAANTLNAGMAEDRAAKREAERAAIETDRWERTFAFKKEQAEEQRKFQAEQLGLQRESFDFQKGRAEVEDKRYADNKVSRQIEAEMDRSYKEMREEMRAVGSMFDNTTNALRKEREALYRIRDSANPMDMMGQMSEQTSIRDPKEVQNRLKYINEQLTDLEKQREKRMGEMRTESLQRLQNIAGAYDPSIVDSSSFKGYMRAAGQELARLTAPDYSGEAGDTEFSNDTQAIAGELGLTGQPAITQSPTDQQAVGGGVRTINPLSNATDNRASRIAARNQRAMQALIEMGNNVDPAVASKVMQRIERNNAELDRIGLLADEFENSAPVITNAPPKVDWRQDPEYLKRRNHFQ